MTKSTTGDDTLGNELDVGSYADALEELASIVEQLESDAVDVDVLADQVERAALLVRTCRSRLDRARHRVVEIVADLDDLEPGPDAEL